MTRGELMEMRVADVINVEGKYYVLATSERVDDRTRVLKKGDTFAVFNRHGDVQPIGLGEQGIYHGDTRFVSRLELLLGDERPLLLSSTVTDDNDSLRVDLTNPDIVRDNEVVVPRGTLHIARTIFLDDPRCYQRVRISNYGLQTVHLSLFFRFESDFADLFEVRGVPRERRGNQQATVTARAAAFDYRGLDAVVRRATFEAEPVPRCVTRHDMRFDVSVAPQQTELLYLTVSYLGNVERRTISRAPGYEAAHRTVAQSVARYRQAACGIQTSNTHCNRWLERSAADVHMMTTDTTEGRYPYAGVPWFSTAFGRDGIITALEYLWLNPDLAAGVLRYLAARQSSSTDAERDAEPGKILHEIRNGEMAALGEVPFARYYGAVDSTPLFIMLAGAYYRRTGDRELVESLWPNIERALHWIDNYGDRDGDGLVEYFRRSESGLVNQGWKDSGDSVFHADGTLATGPIALCEVQGYVYAARKAAAELALVRGDVGAAARLEKQAAVIRDLVERLFWIDEMNTYAIALDGHKTPCRVQTSNPGHLLYCALPSRERAIRLGKHLTSAAMFSGWGVRTLAEGAARYNPMSYHDGSVWPHDNAIIAQGFARYEMKSEAVLLMQGLFDASGFFDLHRLPELFCGFQRGNGESPTEYPVACAPQSWAAAASFSLIQSCLGVAVDAPARKLSFHQPVLPPSVRWVRITNLRVGDAEVDLRFERTRDDVALRIIRRSGELDVIVVK